MHLDLFGIGGNPADFGPVGDNFFSSLRSHLGTQVQDVFHSINPHARAYTPNGMLEYWNIGIMGLSMLQRWASCLH